MIFDWFAKCSVTQLEYAVCTKHETFALVRIGQHPSDSDFMVVTGPAIENGEVVVPWMDLDSDHDKERFERMVLRTLWTSGGDNCLCSIPSFSEYRERDLESQRLDGIADLLEL